MSHLARILPAAVAVLTLAACASAPPPTPDTHLQQADAVPAPAAPRPAPVQRSLDLPPPVARPPLETYTVVVNDVPAAKLLFELARDARLNVDIHPDIRGTVSMNAIDQTLPQILERIASQIDMRYTLEGTLLSVVPDVPFLRLYRIEYPNIARNANSTVSIATQVATTGGTGLEGSGAGSGPGNNSSTSLTNTSNHRYWESLTESIRALLQETDKIVEEPAAATDGEQQADGPRTNVRFREAASVIAQPETGVIAVRATQRQHVKVQEFLDASVLSARRQVLIEATIAEVELNDDFEQGIDWAVIRRGGANLGMTVQPVGGGTSLPGGTPIGSSIPTLGLIAYDHQTTEWDITAALRLLDSFGRKRVLSSPKISVLNNQTALIKVVDNLVYFQLTTDFTPGTAGSPTTFTVSSTPNTVPVGFLMNVTPQIAANDEVILNLRPTISRLTGYVEDPGVALSIALARQQGADLPDVSSRVPEIQTREMESIIKVRDGQIAVLGGLMRDTAQSGQDGLPGLSRLPGAGNLFKYRSKSGTKSELVIFLRPTIVREPTLEGDYRRFRSQLPDEGFLRDAASERASTTP